MPASNRVSEHRAPVLTSARLALRELVLSDLDFVAEMLADPLVMRHYPKTLTRVEAQAWIERQRARYARDGHGLWLVSDQETERPIGQVGLLRQDLPGGADWEVGYLLHTAHWHKGYATEAALAVRDYAFRVLAPGRLISLIRPENAPSQRVARRLGMEATERVQFAGLEHLVFALARPGAAPAS
jgi:[ribosomal protein S5]-alanine N-acetyltransferase